MADAVRRRLRVLAAEDSAVMRSMLKSVFQIEDDGSGSQSSMELCGVAVDGQECLEMVERLQPDALVLDLEMPRLDGIGVLRELRRRGSQIPVVLCSAYTARGARATLDALAEGAQDYVMKPRATPGAVEARAALRADLLPKLAALMTAGEASGVWSMAARDAGPTRVKAVVIGVSTGGPSALEQMLPRLRREFPVPVVVVQHMPKLFTGALAERLNRVCTMPVREAFAGAVIEPGTIWIAPGDAHLEVKSGARRRVEVLLHSRETLNGCRPSVDFLFRSAAEVYGSGTLGVMMTGMGSDGLDGCRSVVQAGGTVVAQDKASSAVWGMPGRVTEAGLARMTVPLSRMAETLEEMTGAGRVARAGSMANGWAAMDGPGERVEPVGEARKMPPALQGALMGCESTNETGCGREHRDGVQ